MSVILLPAARTKAEGGNPFAPDVFDYRSRTTFNFFHELIPDRRLLVRRLQEEISSEDRAAIEELLGNDDVDHAIGLTRELFKAPLMASRKRFAPGVLYTDLDFDGLPTGAQRRFLENTVIIDPLFGLVRPDDMLPDYQLSITATIPDLGRVSDYWKPLVSKRLNEIVRGRFVWDLLPDEYSAMWDDDQAYDHRTKVRFCDYTGEVINEDAAYCGRLVAHLMQQNPKRLLALGGSEDRVGFILDEEQSELSGKALTVVMVRC